MKPCRSPCWGRDGSQIAYDLSSSPGTSPGTFANADPRDGSLHDPYCRRYGRDIPTQDRKKPDREIADTSVGNPLNIDDSLISVGPSTATSDPGRYGVLGMSEAGEYTPVGSVVWGVQPATGRILKIDSATGEVLDDFPGRMPSRPSDAHIGLSIAEDGKSLLYVNSDVDPTRLYRLDPTNGRILSVESVESHDYAGLGSETPQITFYSNTFDSDPQWSTSGRWAFGTPTGNGGMDDGYSNPTSGHTGDNVSWRESRWRLQYDGRRSVLSDHHGY